VPSGCSGGQTTRYGYDQANDLTTRTEPNANGYVATLAHDAADRLTSVTNAKAGTTLSSFTFGSLDGVGNPTSLSAYDAKLTPATRTSSYTYDAYDRLTGACSLPGCTGTGLTGTGYTYDPVGNRTTQVAYGSPNVTTTYRYNADDQLCWTYVGTSSNTCSHTPSGGTTYTFGANGEETAAGSSTFSYDLADRMTQAVISGTTTTYAYDGDGNRTSATTGSTTTNDRWDTNEALPVLATEANGSGTTLRDYAYGAGLDSYTASGSTFYEHLDAYSSVADITDASGVTRWSYAYDPFGLPTAAVSSGGSPPVSVMRFDAQLLDPASGLYDLRARVYDASLGRFAQIDPVPNPTTMPYTGSYAYVNDGPTVLDDSGGLTPIGPPGNLNGGDNFFSDWWNGAKELFSDWEAGPSAPKIVGGVLIAGSLACIGAPEACAAIAARLAGSEAGAVCADADDMAYEWGIRAEKLGLGGPGRASWPLR
jgi:RHS repeat-associated protein